MPDGGALNTEQKSSALRENAQGTQTVKKAFSLRRRWFAERTG